MTGITMPHLRRSCAPDEFFCSKSSKVRKFRKLRLEYRTCISNWSWVIGDPLSLSMFSIGVIILLHVVCGMLVPADRALKPQALISFIIFKSPHLIIFSLVFNTPISIFLNIFFFYARPLCLILSLMFNTFQSALEE